MRLGLRWLRDVSSVNSWNYASQPEFYQGDTETLYLQLVDEDAVGSQVGGLNPAFGLGPAAPVQSVPRRYMPAAGASLIMTLDSIDSAKRIDRVLSQPFPGDTSIWRLDISAADPVNGTVDLILVLNESGTMHRARVNGGLRVRSTQRV